MKTFLLLIAIALAARAAIWISGGYKAPQLCRYCRIEMIPCANGLDQFCPKCWRYEGVSVADYQFEAAVRISEPQIKRPARSLPPGKPLAGHPGAQTARRRR